MSPHELTLEDRQNGGQATAKKIISADCPYCGQCFIGVKQLVFNGHLSRHSFARRYHQGDLAQGNQHFAALGFQAFADRHCAGDLQEAKRKLGLLGTAATDPFPANGAFAHAHAFAEEVAARKATLSPHSNSTEDPTHAVP